MSEEWQHEAWAAFEDMPEFTVEHAKWRPFRVLMSIDLGAGVRDGRWVWRWRARSYVRKGWEYGAGEVIA